MPQPTTLVLLPGLDGTEIFLQPLVAALRSPRGRRRARVLRPRLVVLRPAGADARRGELVPGHNIDEILRLRSSVKVVTIAGSHLAMFTNPRAAARAITAFLEE